MAQQHPIDINWDMQADVVVIGYGAAGAATAITAQRSSVTSACFSTQIPSATIGSAQSTIAAVPRRSTNGNARGSTVKIETMVARLNEAMAASTGRKIVPPGMKTSAAPKPAKP